MFRGGVSLLEEVSIERTDIPDIPFLTFHEDQYRVSKKLNILQTIYNMRKRYHLGYKSIAFDQCVNASYIDPFSLFPTPPKAFWLNRKSPIP